MLSKINLHNVKIHEKYNLEIKKNITLIYGTNGTGKTSILEAISLFTFGKGIFNVDKQNMLKKNTSTYQIKIEIDGNEFIFSYKNPKNKAFLFTKNIISQKTIQEHIKIFGISPYISLAFWHDIEVQRKIINRIIMQYNNSYATYFKEYIQALKKRNLLIKNETFNENWASILDPLLIKNGLLINEIRKNVIETKINKSEKNIEQFIDDELILEMFPCFEDQQSILNQKLEINFQGPHLTRFDLKTKNRKQISTGQQKKILLSLLITNGSQNQNSILLLDDIFNNLDEKNIEKLLNLLSKQNFQTIITHTNKIEHPAIDNIQIT